MKLTFMCGIPNSGKTTKAATLAEQTGDILISLDEYTHLYEDGYMPIDVFEAAIADINAALDRGENVIFDAVNGNEFERQKLVNDCAHEGCEFQCIYMETPVDTCIERDSFIWSELISKHFEIPTANNGYELIVSADGIGE